MGTGYVDDFSERKKEKIIRYRCRDGKIENSELRGCTKLERVEYIKEIPAPGILIFGTLYVLFLCMGWIKVTDFVLSMRAKRRTELAEKTGFRRSIRKL